MRRPLLFHWIVALMLGGIGTHGWAQTMCLEEDNLLASDGSADDEFGISVSMRGPLAIIGSWLDGDGGYQSGAAYVFRYNDGAWMQEQKLNASDATAGDVFGWSVSIDGEVAVVGAKYDDEHGFVSGSAYVYRFDGTVWTQEQKIAASDGEGGDYFGASVSINGDVVIVGASWHDNKGAVYVFRHNGVSWEQEQKLMASDAGTGDAFGSSISISTDVLLVGAPGDDTPWGNSGSAYVFRHNGVTWVQEQKLTAPDPSGGSALGGSVSIHGDLAIVGAPTDDTPFGTSGSAYVYRSNGATWEQEQKLTAPDGEDYDYFGVSVSIAGELAMVGAEQSDGSDTDSGSAYLFRYDGSTWAMEHKLAASDGEAQDQFGYGISMSEDRAIVGALWDSENGTHSGSAYVFDLPSCLCSADTNEDGNVNGDDLSNVILDWGTDGSGHGGDINGDGDVDVDDLTAVILGWGTCL